MKDESRSRQLRPLERGTRLAELLHSPGRDDGSGALPVVSTDPKDELEFLSALDARLRTRVELMRRGVFHGEWVELDPALSGAAPAALTPQELSARWLAAEPIVLRGALLPRQSGFGAAIERSRALPDLLAEPGGLKRWLASRADELDPPFRRLPERRGTTPADPERDLEKVLFASDAPEGARGGGRRIEDLWVKSGWLSTHAEDDSLRVRVSFGREGDDDASGDLLRQRLVADLATRLFPESALASGDPSIVTRLERLCGAPVLLTQHIAYWNGVEGGALFHHDGFSEDAGRVAGFGQLGVCYLQLSGRTAWLALSLATLAARVREFVEGLERGELPWVRAQLWPRVDARARLARLLGDDARLREELARPGCGELAALVNRGPEFTAFLADRGHAALLETGDVILLPNHGLPALGWTAMHSVFCAGDEPAYSLSLAIRADREEPAPPEEAADQAGLRG